MNLSFSLHLILWWNIILILSNVQHLRIEGTIYSLLNRQIVVLLVARKLPKEFLLNLVEKEIQGILIDIENSDVGRRRAYNLVRHYMKKVPNSHSDQSGDINDHEDHNPNSSSSSSSSSSSGISSSSITDLTSLTSPQLCVHKVFDVAEQLQTFLLSGQRLTEPRYWFLKFSYWYHGVSSTGLFLAS